MLSILLVANLAAGQRPPARQEIVVAAAADLSSALKEIAVAFERQTGNRLKLVFGSSGNLFTQIENGAPYDVFLSADMDYPDKLVTLGLARPGANVHYATGNLVLWVPSDSRIDLTKIGMKALLDPSVRKIALANPQHAPYGRAAVAAMQHFELYDRVSSRLVLGENVSQAAQFVESGNAQVGIIALSIALSPEMRNKGKYWKIPVEAYPALKQGAVVLLRSTNNGLANEFLGFIKSPQSSAILVRYGFVGAANQKQESATR